MKRFAAGGVEWEIVVDTIVTARVRAITGVDLCDGAKGQTLERLDNPETLVAVTYAIVEEQAKAAGVSPEAFGRMMVGDALDAAMDALLEAWSDFFPKSRRLMLRRGWTKAKEHEAKLQAWLESDEADRAMQSALDGRTGT